MLSIFQISPIAASPALSDQTKYPNFARLVTSGVAIVDGIIALMKHYGWSRVAAITQQEFLFTKVYSRLNDAIAQEGDDWDVYNAQFATDEDPRSHVTDVYVCSLNMSLLNTLTRLLQYYHNIVTTMWQCCDHLVTT